MPEPLEPFTRRYTPEQVAAVVHAMLDASPKLTAREAVDRATAGTLPGAELEPFGQERQPDGSWTPIPVQTAHYWARKERQERGAKRRSRLAKAGPSGALELALLDALDQIEDANKSAQRKTMAPIDRMRTAREYVAAVKAVHDAHRAMKTKLPAPAPEQPAADTPNEATDLARAARARASTEHDDAPPTQALQGAGTDTQHSHAASEQPNASDSVARMRGAIGHEIAAQHAP